MMPMQEVEIKSGFSNMRFDEVTGLLTKAYWSIGIGRGEVEKCAANSAYVVGAFTSEGMQVGYARVVSDKTKFAYLADIIVDEAYRKRGIASGMVRAILAAPELKDVYQWLLVTRDAHELYRKLGFSVVGRPLDWMEIRLPRPADRSSVG
jgi:ribosomal protein S18 acetylase RimI-like enzyme